MALKIFAYGAREYAKSYLNLFDGLVSRLEAPVSG